MKARVKIQAADLFCGAGGFSSGLLQAAEALNVEVELLAVNHWQIAIETHSRNHPGVRHLCKSVESVNPRMEIPGGRLDLLMASPECVHFSSARGGKPMSDQSRSTAWHILHWLETLDVENLVIENVPEFQTWGPLYPADHRDEKLRNRPIPTRKGAYFRNFLRNLKTLGYRVDHKVLNAANYGDATTRNRLFILARKGRRAIIWPEATHVRPMDVKATQGDLWDDERRPWRPARDIIDWSVPSRSIYERERPLSPNTMARIMAGLRKYSGLPFLVPNFGEREGQGPRTHSVDDPLPAVTSHGAGALVQPFLVVLRNHCDGKPIDGPVPTVAANGNHVGLAEPFILPHQHGTSGPENVRSVEEPLPTVTGSSADMFLAEPYVEPFMVVNRAHGCGPNGASHSLKEPVRSLTTGENMCLVQPAVEPYLVKYYEGSDAAPVSAPLPSITANYEHLGLAEPYIIPQFSEAQARSVDEPLGVITTTSRGMGLAQPCLVPTNHGPELRSHSIDHPMPTITAFDAMGLAEFIIGAGGPTSGPQSVEAPLGTVLTENHRALIQPELRGDVLCGDLVLVPPYLVAYHGGADADSRHRPVDEPIPTQTTANRFGLAQPFLVRYHGTDASARDLSAPLGTITARDRFGLVTPELVELDGTVRQGFEVIGRVVGYLDIRFRMLQPHELAAAMSFPADYEFTGNREQRVRQIGNAVPVRLAAALTGALIGGAR